MIDNVELIVINHFYDERGHLVFDQMVFYDNYPGITGLAVRDWRLIKDGRKKYEREEIQAKQDEAVKLFLKENRLKEIPEGLSPTNFWEPEYIGDSNFQFDYTNKCVSFSDGVDGIKHRVYYRTLSYLVSQVDIELIDREIVPKECRILLGTKLGSPRVPLKPLVNKND